MKVDCAGAILVELLDQPLDVIIGGLNSEGTQGHFQLFRLDGTTATRVEQVKSVFNFYLL